MGLLLLLASHEDANIIVEKGCQEGAGKQQRRLEYFGTIVRRR